jgi:hypothetical protein
MENPIKRLFNYFQKEPAQSLTFGYLLLITIGLIFDFFYYSSFKLNVLLFVELDDLLLAPIQDIGVLFAVFMFCLFTYGLVELDIWWRAKYPDTFRKFSLLKDPFSKKNNARRPKLYAVMFVLYIFNGAAYYGMWQGKKVKNGESKKIVFDIKDAPKDAPKDSTKTNPTFFIGKTKSYFFVYDTATKKATIISSDEVKKLRFEK